jgi:hypothetical protein
MKTASLIIALSFLTQASFGSELLTGTISKKGKDYYIKTSDSELKIESSALIMKSLPSLHNPSYVKQANGRPYAFEFKGERKNRTFKLQEIPTNIPGSVALKGILKYNSASKKYSINGIVADFGYTKKLSGYEFDNISKKSFVGQELIIEGDYNEEKVFIMQALTPVDLFSATPTQVRTDDAKEFILEEMPKNHNSQHSKAFRATVYETNSQVKPGDNALIVTLSGRQGDSFGSVNGHFVSGIAEVRKDLSLRGEVSNAYVTNTKDILSGNVSLTNYFSHTVQGQNVYRPTYTIIAYGIDKSKLKQFRDALEASHIEFRTKKLDITAQFNCTTETVKALRDAGIEGKYIQFNNSLGGIATYPAKLGGETADSVQFAVANDPSRFHPAAAFNSFVKTFLSSRANKKLGVKRVDYVFYPQIPSNRPVGGMALESVWKAPKFKKLYETYEVNPKTKLGLKELRSKLDEILQEIPYN